MIDIKKLVNKIQGPGRMRKYTYFRKGIVVVSNISNYCISSILSKIYACLYSYVVYWPTTRPGCQNRKCTGVNNRCIRSRDNQDIIPLTVDRLNECKIVTPIRRRWAWNYYITKWREEVRQFGDQTSWREDTVEEASTQQREPYGPWFKVGDQTS